MPPQILSTRQKKKQKQNEKRRNIFLKENKRNIKGNGKKLKKEDENEKNEKIDKRKKEGPMKYLPRRFKKLIFYIRVLKGNREAIEAKKKRILSTREKKKNKKKKKKERK